MHFRSKIFIAATGILLCALVLNSVLSISFFEKIYSRSLTAILESAGRNLQQKIERGVRLGKPLDAYEGMPEKLRIFLKDNPRAANVAVYDERGDILYAGKAGTADQELLTGHIRTHLPETEVVTRLERDQYLIYIPLFHRGTSPAGAVAVSVSRQEVRDKIQEMVGGALVRLAWTLGPTSLLLAILLGFFVLRPIRKEIRNIHGTLAPYMDDPRKEKSFSGQSISDTDADDDQAADKPPDPVRFQNSVDKDDRQQPYDFRQVENEIRQLGLYLQAVAMEIRSNSLHCLKIEENLPELAEIRFELQKTRATLLAFLENHGGDYGHSDDLDALLRENDWIIVQIDDLLHEKRRPPGAGCRETETGPESASPEATERFGGGSP